MPNMTGMAEVAAFAARAEASPPRPTSAATGRSTSSAASLATGKISRSPVRLGTPLEISTRSNASERLSTD